MTDWTSPTWHAEALAWADVTPVGPVTQPHLRPWSTALRIPTADGVVWFKAGGSGTAFEARLLRALNAYGAPQLLTALKVDVERGWLLLPDGGPTLRSALDRDPDLHRWEPVLQGYAALQRAVEHRALPGAEDQRPQCMPALLEALLRELPVGPRAELEALQPRFAGWCDELAGSGVVPTLQHDDLHDNNVFASGVVYDWGDAVLAFPFATLLVTLRSAARRWELAPGAPELVRLRDAYLEPWTDTHSRTELELLCLLATRVGKVGRSRAWQRALTGVPDPGEHAEAAPGWLEELLEEDVF
ncbi:MAG: phosphotransferase [Mycobacteriales bacterium]